MTAAAPTARSTTATAVQERPSVAATAASLERSVDSIHSGTARANTTAASAIVTKAAARARIAPNTGPRVITRLRPHAGAIWLLAATTIANVLGYGYQVVMARLLRPEDYAILIALFGVLILQPISSQVIPSATAKRAAHSRARDD